MAISRVQIKGAGAADYAVDTSWSTTLTVAPTAGNTLIAYFYSTSALSISSIVQGGSGAAWTLMTSSTLSFRNLYVYALENVPSGSSELITLTLSSSGNLFCSFIEEISGLAESSILDKSTSANGSATNTYSTGTTATTTTDTGYWANIYASFSSFGSGCTGGSPTDGYTIESSANPLSIFSTGWVPSTAGIGFTPFYVADLILAYKIASSTGTAGGSVTDTTASSNNYNAIALAFKGPGGAPPVTARRRETGDSWF